MVGRCKNNVNWAEVNWDYYDQQFHLWGRRWCNTIALTLTRKLGLSFHIYSIQLLQSAESNASKISVFLTEAVMSSPLRYSYSPSSQTQTFVSLQLNIVLVKFSKKKLSKLSAKNITFSVNVEAMMAFKRIEFWKTLWMGRCRPTVGSMQKCFPGRPLSFQLCVSHSAVPVSPTGSQSDQDSSTKASRLYLLHVDTWRSDA